MDKEIEKKAITQICRMSAEYDYTKAADVRKALEKALLSEVFGLSAFGQKYIKRLKSIQMGINESACVLCDKEAANGVVCDVCIGRIEKLQGRKKPQPTQTVKDGGNVKIEYILKDLGDDMMQLATENSVRTLKKLAWINIGLLIVNSIIIVFLAIILWKFMMAQ